MNLPPMSMLVRSLVLLLMPMFWALPAAAVNYPSLPELPAGNIMDDDEHLLVTALIQVHDNDLDGALKNLKRIVDRNPKFRLARLLYGDLLLARGGVITPFRSRSTLSKATLENLLQEARLRLQNRLNPPPSDALPEQLLQLSESQRYAIVVDISQSRFYVYEQRAGVPVLISNFYATTGMGGALKEKEGDGKTPLGVYFITSRLASENLPDLYGAGAFPINYPNEWDSLQGRTGYGIWLHGVPSNTYNRAPQVTYGCVAIPNNNIDTLWDLLEGETTPVILTREINWVARSELQKRRSRMQGVIERWRKDSQSRDRVRLARNYSKDFTAFANNDKNLLTNKDQKLSGLQKVGLNSTEVALSDVSIFTYPEVPNMVVVTFDQETRRGNTSSRDRIRQYWRYEADGQWRILSDGIARFRKIHLQGIPPSARVGITNVFR